MRGRILILGGLLVAVAVAVAALWSPRELVVNYACEPEGLLAKLKSVAQGRVFWERQSHYLEREIAWYIAAPERQARIEEKVAPDLKRLLSEQRQTMKQLYDQYPDLRPSPTEQVAEQLHAQADAMERAEFHAMLEQMRTETIRRLQDCRPVLTARSKGSK